MIAIMTTNRLLGICLVGTMMQGCATTGTSSTETISNGQKSTSYCFSENVALVTKKIEHYIESCDAHPAREEEDPTGLWISGSNGQAGYFLPATRHTPEVRSYVEIYPKSRRVSLVRGGNFDMVAVVTGNDGLSAACRTSVEFYGGTAIGWASRSRHIEHYLKTGEFDENCLKRHPELPSYVVTPAEKNPAVVIPATVVNPAPIVSPAAEDATSKAPMPQGGSAVQRLKDLKSLYDQGVINKEDFESKKQEILKTM